MYFASICPTKNHPSSAQHAPFHCAACESRCCHNSSAPGDPFGIFPAGIWPPAHPAGIFWHPPKKTLQNQNNRGNLEKSQQKVEPAIKYVWLRFWYVLISVFFVHALKHEVVFVDPQPRPGLSLLKVFLYPFYDLWGAVITHKKATHVN